jgi:hypothetical protein
MRGGAKVLKVYSLMCSASYVLPVDARITIVDPATLPGGRQVIGGRSRALEDRTI